MRLPLSFWIAVVQVALVGLVRAHDESDLKLVHPGSKIAYEEKHYWSLKFEEKAAIVFRPLLNIEDGCDAHAAVFDMEGDKVLISSGLSGGSDSGGCRRHKHNRRMYAKYQYSPDKKKLVLVYALYFPQVSNSNAMQLFAGGAPHIWQTIAIVLNVKPNIKEPAELDPESIWWTINFTHMHTKPWKELNPNEIDGKTHVKFKMYDNFQEAKFAHLGLTGKKGQTIQLLFPEHLPEKVQKVLREELWNDHGAPLSDQKFKKIVDKVLNNN